MRFNKVSFILFLLCLMPFPSVLCAEVVKDVGSDGTLLLASGKQVALAGVVMDNEGISVLRVLVRKQDVKLKLLLNFSSSPHESAYVYLQAKYLNFPVLLGDVPKEQEVLINEFLVKTGAASVDETQKFSQKAKFLKIQEEAKKKGEGIWSYEAS